VAWIDVECNEDIQVAPNFAAFLERLRPVRSSTTNKPPTLALHLAAIKPGP
jgi:hypothetical protein